MTNNEIFQDTPDHQTGLTSSIGGLWPPEKASFERIKAFYTDGIIDSQGSFEDVQAEYESCLNQLDQNTSRVQFRVIVDEVLLHERANSPFMQENIEAIIPLDFGHLGNRSVLIYLGKNSDNRLPQQQDFATTQENLNNALKVEMRPVSQIMNKAELNGYFVETLQVPTDLQSRELMLSQMTELYERFGWERQEVEEMVTNPNNLIAVAKEGSQIVSAGIAEMVSIPIGKDYFRMAEITEAATLNEHGSKGLYTAVSTHLILELTRRSQNRNIFGGEIDLIFGECNGLSAGVLKVVKFQGRTFAAEVGGQYGFPNSGMLPQQVPISGAERNTEYNDLLPAFLTRLQLYALYGDQND